MTTSYSILSFVVLSTILKSYIALEYDTNMGLTSCKDENSPRDSMDAFDEIGYVRLEVSGRPHRVEGSSEIFIGYSDSDGDASSDKSQKESLTDGPYEDENLPVLNALSLETTELHNVSSNTFSWMSGTNVHSLILRNTDIEDVAEDTLRPVQTTLQVLDMSNANISIQDLNALMQGLCNDDIESCSTLSILSMAKLALRTVPNIALRPVQYSLRALSLFGNNFQSQTYATVSTHVNTLYEQAQDESEPEVKVSQNDFVNVIKTSDASRNGSSWAEFPLMPMLIELDLRECKIDFIDREMFIKLNNLQRLFLSNNNIIVLSSFAFQGLKHLSVLDLSLNGKTFGRSQPSGLVLKSNSFADLLSLTTLSLSYTPIHRRSYHLLTRLPQSLHNLNLCKTDLTELTEGTFTKLNRLQVLDLSYNVGLGQELSEATFTGLNMLQELYMIRTSFSNLNLLEYLSTLKVLDLKRNNIGELRDITDIFPSLEFLDVSFNYISSWRDRRALGSSSKLRGLYLHSNSLSLMSSQMLDDFKPLQFLTLGDNNFVCNCPLKEFMEYLKTMNNNTVENLPILVDYRSDSSAHNCTDVSLSKTVRFEDTCEYCIDTITRYWLSALQHSVYISLLVLVCSSSIGGLIYWKWWYIRYVAVLLKNATVLSMINIENCEDRIYLYDIFVSYSDENRNWVIEELIPNIEGPDARFSICLHERDFQVGVSILENIITGMDQSRTILLIVSGCFLKSQWCQFEMHLAQHRLLETCREELVLVLLEEIPRRKRSKILHYLMMVKTYIVWPKNSQDTAAKKLFWKRLRKAITANKSKRTSAA